MNEEAQELLDAITDPRQKKKITHPLKNIIMITICAVICGANTWEEIADFGKAKKEWLKKFLVLPDNKIPSSDTIARLFHIIKVKEFESDFLVYLNTKYPDVLQSFKEGKLTDQAIKTVEKVAAELASKY